MIAQEELRASFSFDRETGLLSRRYREGKVGTVDKEGYLYVTVSGKRYAAHRLIWLYVYGYFPENQVDHINRVPGDNRLCNLREVTASCNTRNSKVSSRNTSGIKGVSSRKGKWSVKISCKGKQRSLGTYQSKLEAAYARYAGEQSLGWLKCDACSSAYNYIKGHM